MGKEYIELRFARVTDILEDLKLVGDEETAAELRERTEELRDDYIQAFEEAK